MIKDFFSFVCNQNSKKKKSNKQEFSNFSNSFLCMFAFVNFFVGKVAIFNLLGFEDEKGRREKKLSNFEEKKNEFCAK